ncbi:uncharacterized protein ZBAI_09617 [Zygosaccharomyces bailii ISA1307]|nr:uncharacterized protein ZBAI_09617 [Zygosaccharomyces bailii ISA1307]
MLGWTPKRENGGSAVIIYNIESMQLRRRQESECVFLRYVVNGNANNTKKTCEANSKILKNSARSLSSAARAQHALWERQLELAPLNWPSSSVVRHTAPDPRTTLLLGTLNMVARPSKNCRVWCALIFR